METWELAARESIRDLLARYNVNGDSGKLEAVVELFAPDAVMEMVDGDQTRTYDGHAGIRHLLSSFKDRLTAEAASRDELPYARHLLTTTEITVQDASHARARSYVAVLMSRGLDHWGRYDDRFAKIDGQWLFVSRRAITERRLTTSRPNIV